MGLGDADDVPLRKRPDSRDRDSDRHQHRKHDRDRERDRRRDRVDDSHGDDRGPRRRHGYDEPREGSTKNEVEDRGRRDRDRRSGGDERSERDERHRRDRRARERRRSQSPESSRTRLRREEKAETSEAPDRRRRSHRERDRDRDRDYRRRSPDELEDETRHRRRRRRRDEESEDISDDEDEVVIRTERDGRSGSHAARPVQQRGPLPDQANAFALVRPGGGGDGGEKTPPPKEQPNLAPTGVLAAASRAVTQADGSVVTLKYHEPPEARKPSAARDPWTLFVFKEGAIVDTVPLHARSCWLVGRDAAVVDLLAAHPSVSKQHAVLQFRYVETRNEFGDRLGRVAPYVLDLASANGTTLNGTAVPAQRYVELRARDLVQFGHSAREYVLMRGNEASSRTDAT